MWFPAVRQMLLSLGVFVIGAVVLVGLVACGVFLIRHSEKKSALGSTHFTNLKATAPEDVAERSVDWKALGVDVKGDQKPPHTTGDLIEQLRAIDWFQFEKVVAVVYRKQGYTVSRRGGANPDGGIDLIISKDGETKAVQCKQWKTWNIGVKSVREFLGALTDARIQKGIFITLRGYTGEAKQLADKHGIKIVNETDLATMLAANDVRFDGEVQETLRDLRKFCPKCEREMVRRTARKGLVTGNQFWGCSAYPRCRFTMPVAS